VDQPRLSIWCSVLAGGSAAATAHLICREPFEALLAFLAFSAIAAVPLLWVGVTVAGLGEGRTWAVVLAVYGTVLVASQPHIRAWNAQRGLAVAGLMTPAVVGLVWAAGRGRWATAGGLWLLLVATTVAVSYNMARTGTKVGYFTTWLS
jgi:hypothetical protein